MSRTSDNVSVVLFVKQGKHHQTYPSLQDWRSRGNPNARHKKVRSKQTLHVRSFHESTLGGILVSGFRDGSFEPVLFDFCEAG